MICITPLEGEAFCLVLTLDTIVRYDDKEVDLEELESAILVQVLHQDGSAPEMDIEEREAQEGSHQDRPSWV